MDLAAKSGSIEILEIGQHLGKKCTKESLYCIMSGHLETFKWVIERYPLFLKEMINVDWFLKHASNKKCTSAMLAFVMSSFIAAKINNVTEENPKMINFNLAMETAIYQNRLDNVEMIVEMANQYGYIFKPTLLSNIHLNPRPTPDKVDIFMYLCRDGGYTKYFGKNVEVYMDAFRDFLYCGLSEPAEMVYSILQGMCGSNKMARDMYLKENIIDLAVRDISTCKIILQHYSIKELLLVYNRIGFQFNRAIDDYNNLELIQFLYDTFNDHYKLEVWPDTEICSPKVFKYLVEKNLINGDTYKGKSNAYFLFCGAGLEAVVWLHNNGIVDCDNQSYQNILQQKNLNKDILTFIQFNCYITKQE
ncbi:hypothetical protein DFA_00111 [Cavenderia fasciculata]|uniref:Uncharacterized protein n=1 Tax=Cavenderia fasciculata TaxID=261658 RepID=F4PXM3_CACFS|nr:uncharacterized protein DFA_00111 [Cavenderia fasciculata]EGG19533.1 hypothetical protein DFA_00111 [Cavenderia fasciculata]|eukprot:XP_004357827.1 hypothetical protein DFA_00111 [Cavenderia fasciculata]